MGGITFWDRAFIPPCVVLFWFIARLCPCFTFVQFSIVLLKELKPYRHVLDSKLSARPNFIFNLNTFVGLKINAFCFWVQFFNFGAAAILEFCVANVILEMNASRSVGHHSHPDHKIRRIKRSVWCLIGETDSAPNS